MSFRQVARNPGMKSVMLTILFTSMGFGIILPILPFYSFKFGATAFDLGLLTAIFAMMSLIFSPLMGRLSDRKGRKKVIMAGTLGFALAYVLFAFSASLVSLFIARAIEAIAAAAIMPACLSLISDYTTERERGKAMALVGTTFSVGFILGPALGGLADFLSIQGAFFLAAFLSIANLLSVAIQIKEPEEKLESHDIAAKEASLLSHVSSSLFFVFAAGMMVSMAIGGLQAVLALYTYEKLGFGASHVGLIFTFIGFLIMVFQFVSGHLINRLGEMRMVQMGVFLSGFGYLLISLADGWITLMLPMAVMVMGNAFVFPSVSSYVSKNASGKRGAVMGLVSSFQSVGQLTGPIAAGLLYSVRPEYAFYGIAAVLFGYFLVFSLSRNLGRRQSPLHGKLKT